MSRLINKSRIQVSAGMLLDPARVDTVTVSGDSGPEIEKNLQTALNALLRKRGGKVAISYLQISGGGDGTTFTVVADVVSSGAGRGVKSDAWPFVFAAYVADGTDEGAMVDARARAVERWAQNWSLFQGRVARLVETHQTYLCGASKGSRVMGFEVLTE